MADASSLDILRTHLLTEDIDPSLLSQVEQAIRKEIDTVTKLSELASKHPYYK
jgi:hypothetical protein